MRWEDHGASIAKNGLKTLRNKQALDQVQDKELSGFHLKILLRIFKLVSLLLTGTITTIFLNWMETQVFSLVEMDGV